jgi:hypothetical protein
MSFDNHYPNRKDWRKPYHRSRAFDRTCRPGGSCPWCHGGRLHKHKRRESVMEREDAGHVEG